LGFSVEQTGGSLDGGIDLIATRVDDIGLESRLLIQCKNLSDVASVSVVRELLGSTPDRATGTKLVLACPSGFSPEARSLAKSRFVEMWDSEALEKLASLHEGAAQIPNS